MHVTLETPEQVDRRLRRVGGQTSMQALPGDWWYEEFPPDRFLESVRADAVALVRDGDGWSQLVPVRDRDRPRERLRVWSFHFPDGVDNSGFVGWLATRIKAATGSGILVVCGQNSARGGIYDYWACPVDAADAVLAEISALTTAGPGEGAVRRTGPRSLHGLRMRAVATAAGGEVDADTVFTFSQEGTTVWAHYAGGAVQVGYLVGSLAPGSLTFRYAQVDRRGDVDGGHSRCDVTTLADGRVRLLEHFQWESRDGAGTNVLEEVIE